VFVIAVGFFNAGFARPLPWGHGARRPNLSGSWISKGRARDGCLKARAYSSGSCPSNLDMLIDGGELDGLTNYMWPGLATVRDEISAVFPTRSAVVCSLTLIWRISESRLPRVLQIVS